MNCYTPKNIKINKFIFIFTIFSIFFLLQTTGTKAEEKNVIKVGYPTVHGFTEIKDGVYSGYAYEYLREIAKYTGWEYEFIEMSLSDALSELRDGNIDILAGMFKTDQTIKLYDFPEYNSGYTYTTLSKLKDNKNISQSNFSTFHGIKVGYFDTYKIRLNNFIQFCKYAGINDISLIEYPFKTGKELSEALEDKEVDAIIGGDLLLDSNEMVVAKFGSMPQYFATTKGKTEIIQKLNDAIFKIKENDSSFEQNLYNKYFQNSIDHSIVFSKEEQDYINNMAPLKAIYIDNYIPMQYYDSDNKKAQGVFVDFLNLLSKKSGLRFELVRAKNYEDAYQIIKDNKADLFIGTPSVYSVADENKITLTKSYITLDMVKVFRKNEKIRDNEKKIVALPIGYNFFDINNNYEINYYDTLEECLSAVEKGKADLTYGNSYSISNYITSGYYPNLTFISNSFQVEASIGLSKNADKNLINIINKVVYSLSQDEIQDIIYNNTINIKHQTTIKKFFFDNLALCITIILLIFIMISTFIYIIVKMEFKNLKMTKSTLLEKSQKDFLTGLYNREACEQLVTEYLSTKNSSTYCAFVIIDIDHFKEINDSFGHKIGDDLLKEFSKILKESFSNQDIICRLGGDEFVVFMKDINEENLQIVNEKLQQISTLMDKEVRYNGFSKKISLSIGSIITKRSIEFNNMYKQSDKLLYDVKRNGRNGFKIKNLTN